jgi:hypothetical protein
MGEGVVKGVESLLAGNGEEQRFFGRGLGDFDADAVVAGAPVERHVDAPADPAGKLAARVDEDGLEGVQHLVLVGRLGNELSHGESSLSLSASFFSTLVPAVDRTTAIAPKLRNRLFI